ncbi:oxidoreductase AflX [Achaetomium macrosporum]|uniref:Oxidoreductase AflX n=1 Tax=Achaetomium macrosporum TaxID=79813 RepID=A0AAN7C958_9PEZI|nr:oxidoreductase AflX [Achaetomium macrosporum]
MSSPPPANKTILFLGATGGVGLSALRRAVAAGHTCIALCRTPSKLAAHFPSSPVNLHLAQGNAHDADTLAHVLVHPSDAARLVDIIIFSIGARPTLRGMEDAHVCERGMTALLSALRTCRENTKSWRPRIVAVSTTGISTVGRDIPLLMVPLYKVLLHTPHADKKIMERLLVESGEEWVIVRGSLYTNGPETEGLVREGMEDPVAGAVVGEAAVGYTISREDVGKWVFENCIRDDSAGKWVGKAAMITY